MFALITTELDSKSIRAKSHFFFLCGFQSAPLYSPSICWHELAFLLPREASHSDPLSFPLVLSQTAKSARNCWRKLQRSKQSRGWGSCLRPSRQGPEWH